MQPSERQARTPNGASIRPARAKTSPAKSLSRRNRKFGLAPISSECRERERSWPGLAACRLLQLLAVIYGPLGRSLIIGRAGEPLFTWLGQSGVSFERELIVIEPRNLASESAERERLDVLVSLSEAGPAKPPAGPSAYQFVKLSENLLSGRPSWLVKRAEVDKERVQFELCCRALALDLC